MTQFQLYYVEAGRGYTATATSPSEALHKVEATLVDLLQKLTLTGGGNVGHSPKKIFRAFVARLLRRT